MNSNSYFIKLERAFTEYETTLPQKYYIWSFWKLNVFAQLKEGENTKKQLNPDYKFFMNAFTALPNPLRDWIKNENKKLFALVLNEIIK